MDFFLTSMIIAFGLATLAASFVSMKDILPLYLLAISVGVGLAFLTMGGWGIFFAILAVPAFLSSLFGLGFGAIIREARKNRGPKAVPVLT